MPLIDYKTEWYSTKDYQTFEEYLPEYWSLKYEDRFLQMSEHCQIKSILEVGCGTGRALSHFKKYGVEVLGIEPSDYGRENSKLFEEERIQGDFLEVDIDKKFDVVYFEQVLSHIPQANEAIRKSISMLNDGGILAIEEPNDYNPLQLQVCDEKGMYWITDDHCNYYNFNSMIATLEAHGLKVALRSCTYPMELFYMMGFDYIGDDEIGQRVHKMRYNLLSKMTYEQRKEMKKAFAKMSWGRDLFLIAKGVNNG